MAFEPLSLVENIKRLTGKEKILFTNADTSTTNGVYPLEDLKAELGNKSLLAIVGPDTVNIKNGVYIAGEVGVYPNFGNINVTQEDLESGIVLLSSNSDGTFSKEVTGLVGTGKVTPTDKQSVSGMEVYDYVNNKMLVSNLFTEKGYLSNASGNFFTDNVRLSTPFLLLGVNNVEVKTQFPSDISTIANCAIYDIDLKLIKTFRTSDVIVISKKDYPSAEYFRACGDSRFDFSLNYKGVSELTIGLEKNNERILDLKNKISGNPIVSAYENNMWTQAATNNFAKPISGNYGGGGTKYEIENKSTNGVIHLAFKFRINEDVNTTDGVQKSLVRLEGNGNHLDFFMLCKKTKQFEGGEQDNSTVNTRTPIPFYQSRFGLKSNLTNSGLNVLMNERGLKYQVGSSGSNLQSTKPICGEDVFSIKINVLDGEGKVIRDTTSAVAQIGYEKWKDAYIEITETDVVIKNELLGLNKVYSLSTYGLIRTLFENIYRDLNGFIVENTQIEVSGINVASYNDNQQSKFLLKHRYYLATQYSRLDGVRNFYDSYPAYIVMAIDASWHTFELVVPTNKDQMYYCIDGQYSNIEYTNVQTTILNIKNFINSCDKITLGSELNISIRDLKVEFNQYSGVTTSRVLGTYDTVLFSSDLHPMVWSFFGHDIYHSNYSGGVYSSYTKLVSNGGKIPNELFYTDRNGDGTPNIKRAGIYQPSWQFESAFSMMKESGFKPITHKQYVEFIKTGKAPYERCFVIGFDDMPSYIYSDLNLRRIFTKYGVKPYLALELGWYVDKDAPTTSYNALDWINENKDTNERRLKLQRTLKALQNDDWGIELHGPKEGYVFRGSTYFEMVDAIKEAVSIGEYLGIETSSWCIAGNYQTPNMIKLFEHIGIEVGTSTVFSTTSRAFSDYYAPRTLVPSSYARQRMYFPLTN